MQIVVIFCMHSQIKNEWENITIKISFKKWLQLCFHGECYGEFGMKAANFPYP